MCTVIDSFFFFNAPASTEIYTLSLHDALPICGFHVTLTTWTIGWKHHLPATLSFLGTSAFKQRRGPSCCYRSEEHTSELQSRRDLVCRLLLEKKKNKKNNSI